MKKIRTLVFVGLLIAMNIILTRFLSIQTPIVRISFGFLPASLSGILFGPVIGGITCGLSDVMGMIVYPKGAYFPGFTLSGIVGGVIYGLMLYKKPKTVLNITAAVIVAAIIPDLILDTLWLKIITGKAVYAIIVPRLLSIIAMIPVKVISIKTVLCSLKSVVAEIN